MVLVSFSASCLHIANTKKKNLSEIWTPPFSLIFLPTHYLLEYELLQRIDKYAIYFQK